jgi:hypothetical protein
MYRACYMEGSYADNDAVNTSDVDLLIVFAGGFERHEEQEQAKATARSCIARSEVELDIEITDERSLAPGIKPALKMGSLLIYGEEIRDSLPLMSLEEGTRDRMHTSYWRIVKLFNRPDVVIYPLDYPDPSGEFYGYNRRKLRLRDGQEVNCTRDLIRLAGWSATALIAFNAGRYVARKSDCHRIYSECFADEWGQLLQDIYEQCRGRWNYLIPTEPSERQALRSICERTLGFENHFLLHYKRFLLSELRGADSQGRQQVVWVLKQIMYRDEEIQEALAVASDE